MNINIGYFSITVLILIPLAVAAMYIKPKNKWFILRAFIYIIALLAVLNPRIIFTSKKKLKPAVSIFIDKSVSMSVEERIQNAVDSVNQIYSRIKSISEVSIYTFGESLEKTGIESLNKISADGSKTEMYGIFETDRDDIKIILSDGRNNSGTNPLNSDKLSKSPVFPIGFGSDKKVPDLEIIDLKYPGFGFRNQDISIKFSVTNKSGYIGKTEVHLKQDEKLISSKQLNLGEEKRQDVEIEFSPGDIGLKNYTLKVDKIPGEINTLNNTRNFQIQVKREKIRVLYVSGQPSWEYALLRRLFKSDPQIELVSFLILRNPDNVTIVPENELSLIHFPAREMFTKKIYEFDVLFYDNFSYQRFFPKSYLDHIKKFVLKGGAFIMLGGEDSYQMGGYMNTPIEEILPLKMKPENYAWKLEKFKPVPEGSLNHPILNIGEDREISAEVWNKMPEMEGYNPALSPQNNANVLMKTENGIPVLAVANVGEGRVLAFNNNTTWRWCMGLAGQGRSPYYYNKFWHKTIRYMIKSGKLNNVQVFPGKDRAIINSKINVNIKVVDSNWYPINDAGVKLNIQTPSSEIIPIGWAQPTGEGGWYNITVPVTEKGMHKINVRAYKNDMLIDEGKASFAGVQVNKELLNTSLNQNLLKKIAQISQGKYMRYPDLNISAIISSIEKTAVKTKTTKKINWHNPLFYLFIVLIISIEWYIRIRNGNV